MVLQSPFKFAALMLHFLIKHVICEVTVIISQVAPIGPLAKITPERECWRVKVRIVQLWFLPNLNNPFVINSIEMAFMEEFCW